MGKITPTPQSQQKKLSAPVPLTADHDLSDFDCGEPALNDWLKRRALMNESRFSRTYVACDGNRGVAYFCISAGAVERASAPGKVRRNAPDAIPISVIGRLAVSRDYAGRGLGAVCCPMRFAASRSPPRASASAPCSCMPRTMRRRASIWPAQSSSSIQRIAARCFFLSKQ